MNYKANSHARKHLVQSESGCVKLKPLRLCVEDLRRKPAPVCRLFGVVYFAQSQSGFIKIGFTKNLHRRIHELNHCTPELVHILFSEPGDKDDEARYHWLFGKYRHRGEWFRPEGDLLSFIGLGVRV